MNKTIGKQLGIMKTAATLLLDEMHEVDVTAIANYPEYMPDFQEFVYDILGIDSEYISKANIKTESEETKNNLLVIHKEFIRVMEDVTKAMEENKIEKISGYPEYLPNLKQFIEDMKKVDYSEYDEHYMEVKKIKFPITTDEYGHGPVTVEWQIDEKGNCINTFNGLFFCNILTGECVDSMKKNIVEIFKQKYNENFGGK